MDTLVELTEESLSEKYDLPDGVLLSQIRDKLLPDRLSSSWRDGIRLAKKNRNKTLTGARKELARRVGDVLLSIVDNHVEVMIAGGAVTASLSMCGHGDVDLYICTENDAVRTTVLNDIINELKLTAEPFTVVRSKFAIGFVCSDDGLIQIVLASDCTPEQVLQNFDLDSSCLCYTKGKFFGLKRGIRALQTQVNVVDMSRRTCTYEYRLVKYYKRGFDVLLPGVHFDDLSQEKLQEEKHGVALLARYDEIKSPFGIRSYYETEPATWGSPWSDIAIAYNAILCGKQPTTVSAWSDDQYFTVINDGKYPEKFVEWYITKKRDLTVKKVFNSVAMLSHVIPEINFCDYDVKARTLHRLEEIKQQLLAFTLGPIKFISSNEMRSICADNMTEKQKDDWLCIRDL
jgi:hypothetical protein